MLLTIVRHAEAEDRAPSDAERPLTDKGRRQAKRLGKRLAESGCRPARILTSPYLRAAQTAEILAAELKPAQGWTEAEVLACGLRPGEACALIEEHFGGDLLLVGHEPDLSALCAHLLGLPNPGNFEMKKGAAAVFELTAARSEEAVLLALLPPKYV